MTQPPGRPAELERYQDFLILVNRFLRGKYELSLRYKIIKAPPSDLYDYLVRRHVIIALLGKMAEVHRFNALEDDVGSVLDSMRYRENLDKFGMLADAFEEVLYAGVLELPLSQFSMAEKARWKSWSIQTLEDHLDMTRETKPGSKKSGKSTEPTVRSDRQERRWQVLDRAIAEFRREIDAYWVVEIRKFLSNGRILAPEGFVDRPGYVLPNRDLGITFGMVPTGIAQVLNELSRKIKEDSLQETTICLRSVAFVIKAIIGSVTKPDVTASTEIHAWFTGQNAFAQSLQREWELYGPRVFKLSKATKGGLDSCLRLGKLFPLSVGPIIDVLEHSQFQIGNSTAAHQPQWPLNEQIDLNVLLTQGKEAQPDWVNLAIQIGEQLYRRWQDAITEGVFA
jgi:hypothetical protein